MQNRIVERSEVEAGGLEIKIVILLTLKSLLVDLIAQSQVLEYIHEFMIDMDLLGL